MVGGVSNELQLLVSDKEEFFVVKPDKMFQKKAEEAVTKNFVCLC